MKIFQVIAMLAVVWTLSMSNSGIEKATQTTVDEGYKKSLADYNAFKDLVAEVESYRSDRLINLDTFLEMSKEENTIILDTRSDFRYNRKHIKGAAHLSFSDFTQGNLWDLIPPEENMRILIYCNNNFEGDATDFATKISFPRKDRETQILSNRKPIMLALNIPTYINLYGYGYREIFELDELVNVKDPRIEFEGTEVK